MAKPSPSFDRSEAALLRRARRRKLEKKKKGIGIAVLAVMVLGGIGVASVTHTVGGGSDRPEISRPESRNPNEIPAPPRPPRTKPVERIIVATPK